MQANVLRPAWQGKVRSVAEDKAGRMVVELETPPPLPEEGRWVAENLTLSPEVTVKRCVFRGNRARGMLLTCRSALVEDCLFEVPGAAVYLEGEAEYWYESRRRRIPAAGSSTAASRWRKIPFSVSTNGFCSFARRGRSV